MPQPKESLPSLERQQVVEGLLFVSSSPVSIEKLAQMTHLNPKQIQTIIKGLNRSYLRGGRAFTIHNTSSGWQMRTIPELASKLAKAEPFEKMRLSPKSLETLSIIAYRQPITKAMIDKIKAVDSSYTLGTLLEKNLIKISSRAKNLPGRPFNYRTTDFFLEMFGFSSLKDLPKPGELNNLLSV